MSTESGAQSPGRSWKTLLGLAVSVIFLVLLLRKIELHEVLDELRRVDVAILSLSLLTKFCSFLVHTLRSRILFRPLRDYTFIRLLRSLFLAFALNNFLPLRMGDLARVEYLSRTGDLRRSSCLAVVGIEKLLDMFCLVLLIAAVIPLTPIDIPVLGQAAITIATVGGGFGFLLWASRRPETALRWTEAILGRVHRRFCDLVVGQLGGLLNGLAGLRSGKAVAAVVATAFLYWAFTLLGTWVWILALELALPWYAPMVVAAFVAFGVALPSSPGSVGTYHYFAAAAMTTLGVDPAKAVTFAVVGHFMAQVPFTLLAAPIVLSEPPEQRRGTS